MRLDQKQEVRVHIRWMIRRDMPEVLGIENQSFEFPWSGDDFVRCLRQCNCIGMVAEHEDRVVGFMIYELLKRGSTCSISRCTGSFSIAAWAVRCSPS